MPLIFRSAYSIKKSLASPSKSFYFKFNFPAPVLSICRCECKNLITLSLPLNRKYSTNKIEANSSHEKLNEKGKSDKSSNDNEIIYTGALTSNVRSIKVFSLFTSILGLSAQPIVYSQAVANGTSGNVTISVFAIIGIFALLTPPLINLITKRYVISVEYNPKEDNYIATTYNLFVMRKKMVFNPEDVTIPTVLGMFSSCTIKGKPVFIDASSFTNISHYGRIMGYDKPLDLQTLNNENEFSPKKN